jgi:hypothetical protein
MIFVPPTSSMHLCLFVVSEPKPVAGPRREDHRLVLTSHAPLGRVGDGLHRGGMSLGKRNKLSEETVRFGW